MDNEIVNLQYLITTANDQRAFKALYKKLFSSLVRFATAIVHSKEAAEEIVSDLFIKIWQQRDKLQSVKNLKVYCYTAVKNSSINYLSQKSKALLSGFDDYTLTIPSADINPEERLISTEMILQIETAVNDLPPRCRMIFQLIRQEGLKYKEVAELLNISVNTIDNQMAIAVKKIGQSLSFNQPTVPKASSSPAAKSRSSDRL